MNESTFIVCYSGHPVRFSSHIHKHWSVVHVDDASTFDTPEEAEAKLVDWSLKGNPKFSIRRKILPEPVTKS